MEPMSNHAGASSGEFPPLPLRITNWPLRDERLPAWLTVLGVLLAAAWVASLTASWPRGMAALLALTLSLWRLWCPVTFEFGQRGIVQICCWHQRRIPWSRIVRFEVRSRGVVLSPDPEPTTFSSLRSLHVQWNGQRDALLRVLEKYVATPRN